MVKMKIDHRHNFGIMLDTETANTLIDANGRLDMTSVLVYDLGGIVTDTKGRIYERFSFINKDIFFDEAELMQSAYYSKKIPKYKEDIANGKREVVNTYEMKKYICDLIEKYGCTWVAAHNARFDYNALNKTQRWVTKSKYRYFLPYGVEIWDTMKMAKDVIGNMPTYRKFCEENNFLTKTGRLSMTAENLYRFISKDVDFIESHTGLEDVEIELEILKYCFRQHKKMRKKLWEN